MRKISLVPILVFSALFSLSLLIAGLCTYLFHTTTDLKDFSGIVSTLLFIALFVLSCIACDRVLITLYPLPTGDIPLGSKDEYVWNIHVLFYLVVFNSLIRTRFIPVPFMRVIYLMLGAKLGPNTYTAGTILDPPLTRIGANTILGQDSVLFSHVIEGVRLELHPITIGDRVTIGANSVLMSGVTVGDGAMVACGAVVLKGTTIGADEIWGGVPARRLGTVGGKEPEGELV